MTKLATAPPLWNAPIHTPCPSTRRLRWPRRERSTPSLRPLRDARTSPLSKGGRGLLEFASVDRAGNQGRIVRDSVNVEGSKPYFLSLSGSADATSSTARMTWSAAENDPGIAGFEVRVDGGAFFSVG